MRELQECAGRVPDGGRGRTRLVISRVEFRVNVIFVLDWVK